MLRNAFLRSIVAGVLASLCVVAAAAAADKCETCGNCCMKPVCRVVCEMKKVPEVTYKCVCEDFCLPGRSQQCGCKQIPTCGCPRTRTKLVKIETIKEVPTYKCVVEYVCCKCCQQSVEEAPKDPAPVPPSSAANESKATVSQDNVSQAGLLTTPGTQR